MSISFNQISSTIRTPGTLVEIDNSRASQGPAALAYRALIIGQKTSAGTATANTIVRVSNVNQALLAGGRGSMLHRQAIAWFASNKSTELYLGVLADNGAAVAATKTVTLTGTATAAGTLSLYVGNDLVQVAVASGDANTAVAAALNTALGLKLDLPVSSGVASGVVTLTARNLGAVGQDLSIRVNYQSNEATPAGITVAIANAVSGATNPTLTTLIAAMGDLWFQVIAHPYTDATSLSAIEAEMSSRFGPARMVDGIAITSAVGSQSTLGTLGDSRNSPHSVIVGQAGITPITPPLEFAAETAAIVAYYAAIDPARPFQTLVYVNAKAPADADLFDKAERNLMLYDGISTSLVAAGGIVQMERLVTTYQTNAAGAADTSYLDVTTMLTILYLRYTVQAWIPTRYPRHKLVSDGVKIPQGQAAINPQMAKAEMVAWFLQMADLLLVEGVDQFKRDLIVLRNVGDPNRLDIVLPPDLANQLMVTAIKLQFLL